MARNKRETAVEKRAWAVEVVRALEELYPDARCELDHLGPYQLLVATILSAQSTDKMVNQVTPALFARFPDPAALARAELGEVERLVHKTGFFRSKARSITTAAQKIVAEHGGAVPGTMEQLVKLPGVGRKTANVVLGECFGVPGVVTDTHVIRLSGRIGLSKHADPVDLEQDLMKLIPREAWTMLSHRLIWHGRRVCYARKPECWRCGLATLCRYPDKTPPPDDVKPRTGSAPPRRSPARRAARG